MKLIDVLANKIFDFPLVASDYFPGHFTDILVQYRMLLESVDDEYAGIVKENLGSILETCDNLIKATDAIFRGNTAEAYVLFSNTISRLEPHLTNPNKNYIEMNPTHLFKARSIMNGEFGLTDMFHVPFEKRYLTTTTRFSLPGVPCLYLANSIYTCWEELDRPSFAQMPVSRFELSGKNFRFLDFSNKKNFISHRLVSSYKPNTLFTEEEEAEMFKKLIKTHVLPRYLNTYPLLAACYIKVANRHHHFKPEYVFPQMVMQWIMTQQDIDGVKYLSTKCKALPEHLAAFQDYLNYAIPIQSYQERGYCQMMTKRVSLTEPVTFELFSIMNPEKSTKIIDFNNDIKGKLPTPPIHYVSLGNNVSKYLHTHFGILEHELMQMKVKNI